MKKTLCIFMAIIFTMSICACGLSEEARMKNTYKRFLISMKDADIKEFVSYSEVRPEVLSEDERKRMDEYIDKMSNKEFYETVSSYLRWVSGNDNFSCDNGIDKMRIKKIEVGEIRDEGYQKSCPVTAHVLITADNEDYDLHIKTQFFTIDDIWVIDMN